MDREQINNLKVLSQRATPGPWASKNDTIVYSQHKATPLCVCKAYSANDEAYIAAANPIAIMELIEENKYLQAVVNGYKNANDEAQEVINELKAKAEQLEKEADWLAAALSELGNLESEYFSPQVQDCPNPKIYDCCYGDCQYCWRTAAREAVDEQIRKQQGAQDERNSY